MFSTTLMTSKPLFLYFVVPGLFLLLYYWKFRYIIFNFNTLKSSVRHTSKLDLFRSVQKFVIFYEVQGCNF